MTRFGNLGRISPPLPDDGADVHRRALLLSPLWMEEQVGAAGGSGKVSVGLLKGAKIELDVLGFCSNPLELLTRCSGRLN